MNRLKKVNLVGSFIRERRELLKLSQRELGQKFEPAVTTQFVSNLERGITPLPPVHIANLTKALNLAPGELQVMLEKEYVVRLSNRLHRGLPEGAEHSVHSHEQHGHPVHLAMHSEDHADFKRIYDLYRSLDASKRSHFLQQTQSLLEMVNSVHKIG